MKNREPNPSKELYARLRSRSCAQLWEEEVARFDQATAEDRLKNVPLVRAVGVVFAASGTDDQKEQARKWLRALLHDPAEKIRRYAMTALPKLGAGLVEEADLLGLLRTTSSEREQRFLGATLEKIGGTATLQALAETHGRFQQAEQKIKASLARSEYPSALRIDRIFPEVGGLRIHLRGRKGLETMVRAEVEEHATQKFRVADVRSGLVTLTPTAPFSLGDLYLLRCFGTAGLILGEVRNPDLAASVEAVAAIITSPLARRLLETFTEGSVRYRLELVGKGHQRATVRHLANRAYALFPEILNDARGACWTVAIYPTARGSQVELCPRWARDPRFSYRQEDVPAASHPPLAACMAQLAGRANNEIVWDPFCGSGLELIERARRGGVARLFGTDLSAQAIASTRSNILAAGLDSIPASLSCCDFRDFRSVPGLGPNTVTLILTNPPLGQRVAVSNLRRLIEELVAVAATVLRPGGRLVFANPLRVASPHPLLKLEFSQMVDLGVMDCRLQKYIKIGN